jgi:DeoR/GlpR family transcriptional regulator of sugar metabolism
MNQSAIELVLLGGYVYPRTGVALGPIAEATLGTLRVPRLVMSVGGITENGLFNSNTLLVECERRMLDAADEVWLVADSSKFGRAALVRLCGLDRVHRVICDEGLSDEWRARLADAGVTVTLVE